MRDAKTIIFMKGIYIFLADGVEDVEVLGTNDVLRRAGLDRAVRAPVCRVHDEFRPAGIRS